MGVKGEKTHERACVVLRGGSDCDDGAGVRIQGVKLIMNHMTSHDRILQFIA